MEEQDQGANPMEVPGEREGNQHKSGDMMCQRKQMILVNLPHNV